MLFRGDSLRSVALVSAVVGLGLAQGACSPTRPLPHAEYVPVASVASPYYTWGLPETSGPRADGPPGPRGGAFALALNARFSPETRRQCAQGTVRVRTVIDASGAVVAAEPAEPGHPWLDYDAVRAVRATAWEPGHHAGRPVAVLMEVPVNFRRPDC